jgi:hypothetical protein
MVDPGDVAESAVGAVNNHPAAERRDLPAYSAADTVLERGAKEIRPENLFDAGELDEGLQVGPDTMRNQVHFVAASGQIACQRVEGAVHASRLHEVEANQRVSTHKTPFPKPVSPWS